MRPNFSGSHTFSLMATAKIIFLSPCPLECYFQSKTKIEPDLRLAMIGKKAKIDPLRSASEATCNAMQH